MSVPLLSLWDRRTEFGSPIGCVSTTFTFDAGFFEEECLGRFLGIETDAREAPQAYVVEREEKFSEIFACVLVDRHHVAAQRSLRWHLLPCQVPRGGILHCKVALLVWRDHVRVIVGSANLTSPGYRTNFESVGVLDFTPDGESPKSTLKEVLDFLENLRGVALGSSGGGTEGPQPRLRSFLQSVRRQVTDWEDAAWPSSGPRVMFLPLLPGGPSLFTQIRDDVWRGTGPSQAVVVSPFYDPGPTAVTVARDLVDTVMGVQGERSIVFVTPGRELPDKTIELHLPASLKRPCANRLTHDFEYTPERDDAGEIRPTHAKHLMLTRDGRAVHIVGSSNFTAAGTGSGSRVANVEANLAYQLPNENSAFGLRCWNSMPPSTPVSDLENVSFLADVPDKTPETEGYDVLPAGFGLALFRPTDPCGDLLLHLSSDVPQTFVVRSEHGDTLLDGDLWRADGEPSDLERTWSHPRPPSHLIVDWRKDEVPVTSVWVVNVTDASRLLPPEELRNLSLEELLEILTSARPLHEAVTLVLRKRGRNQAEKPDLVVDPHGKVDTSNFLLRRVRRVSAALEGLRARLERPATSLESLRWRLRGPVGPVALARRLADREGDAAAFMLAEVALTVHRVDWKPLERLLGKDRVSPEVEQVIDELRDLASHHPAPENLAGYVNESFMEIGR